MDCRAQRNRKFYHHAQRQTGSHRAAHPLASVEEFPGNSHNLHIGRSVVVYFQHEISWNST